MFRKKKLLDDIAQEISVCTLCREGKSGMPVPGEGNPEASIVFIGEAPGRLEAQTGRPFIGRSGQLLRSLIRSIGLLEEDVFITSPVKYLPDRGTPTSTDIAHGRVHLMKQFDVIRPRIVVLLGRVAAEGVLEQKISPTRLHGTTIEKNGRVFFITFHPAAALRLPKKIKPFLEQDFRTLVAFVKK